MKIFITGLRGIPNVMGGIESHCEELFPLIAKLGFDITICRRSKYVDSTVKEYCGVNFVDLYAPNKAFLESFWHTFLSILCAKKNHADIIHIHAIGNWLLVPLAKLFRLRVVVTHHGFDYDRDKWNFFAKFMLRLGERLGCYFADDIIVISNVIKQTLAKKYKRTKRVHLIYNGVPTPEFCEYNEYFTELGIERKKYIFAACRFVPEKCLYDLIKAYVNLEDKSYKLVIAGDADFQSDYVKKLKNYAKENGVVLTGFIKGEKLKSLFSNAALYVLPSSHEGLPIALLEAMSYKLPVVVSNIQANLEIGLAQNDYFKCGDINELIERINEKLKTNNARIDYDISKYSWKKIAEQTAKVYRA